MKIRFALSFVVLFGMSSQAQNDAVDEITTYYLIRHAEKDRSDSSNKDPGLNVAGQKRADLWRDFFKNISLDAIYATNYERTKQTAAPTAKAKNLDIKVYDANDLYSEIFRNATKRKSVLVVGHNNTTPAFANAILDKQIYKVIDDRVNSNVYVITVSGGKVFQELLTVK